MRGALLALLLAAPACAQPDTVTVFAAASLTEPFGELAEQVEGSVVSFAASSQLAAQIRAGAEADVLATADEDSMRLVTSDYEVFARNRLTIAVPAGNPARIGGLEDLARPGVVVVLCAEQVPCGRLASEVLRRAGVEPRAASREENVKAVATKVALGEADAGIVYATDVRTARLEEVPIPDALNASAVYPIARLTDAPAAREFVELVLSERGRAVLRRHGFEVP